MGNVSFTLRYVTGIVTLVGSIPLYVMLWQATRLVGGIAMLPALVLVAVVDTMAVRTIA